MLLKRNWKAATFMPNPETITRDRPSWYSNVTRVAKIAERHHIAEAQGKCAAQEDRTLNTHMSNSDHICITCGRGFLARIGLYSHLCIHQRYATTHT
jgi:hypothetical protein